MLCNLYIIVKQFLKASLWRQLLYKMFVVVYNSANSPFPSSFTPFPFKEGKGEESNKYFAL